MSNSFIQGPGSPVAGVLRLCVEPHQAKYVTMLERVQSFAARIASHRWDESSASLRDHLHWPLLASRRQFHRLLMCRRILSNQSVIPCSVFTPHPSRIVRHVNSCPLFVPFVKTQYNRCSFFVGVIALWNSLPEEIVCLRTDLAFKRHLRQYLVV